MTSTEETKETNEPREASDKPRSLKSRTFSRYVLPSNRHPFSTHFDVLRRFVTISRNGSEGVAAASVEGEGVPIQSASMNVRFLRSIDLLVPKERGRYVPTQEAIRFVNAKSVSDERARPLLNALVSASWFAEVARSVFSTQAFMSEDRFLGELALAAQTDKSTEERALRVLVDYLVYTEVLVRDEKGLTLGNQAGSPIAREVTASPRGEGALQTVQNAQGPDRTPEGGRGFEMLQTQDFYVKVRSDPAIVDDLIEFLETLKRKIARGRGADHHEIAERDNSAQDDSSR